LGEAGEGETDRIRELGYRDGFRRGRFEKVRIGGFSRSMRASLGWDVVRRVRIGGVSPAL